VFELSSLDITTGFTINGIKSWDLMANTVSAINVGDVNGDGVPDISIGAERASDSAGQMSANESAVIFYFFINEC
jgi:hypothetical protein